MGLLSKMTAKVTPQKKASDDALLLHAMMCMCGADGVFDQNETSTLDAYFVALPEFEGKQFDAVYQEALKVLRKFPSVQESVKGLSELSSRAIKDKAYLLAADIAMASGDVDENEDRMLDAIQRVCEVDDGTAGKILEVLAIKYSRPS